LLVVGRGEAMGWVSLLKIKYFVQMLLCLEAYERVYALTVVNTAVLSYIYSNQQTTINKEQKI